MTPRKRVLVDEEGDAPRVSVLTIIRRTIRTAAIVLVILYIALLLIARTAGFCDLVAQRLEKFIGMPVKIGGASIAWDFDLRLTDVVTEGADKIDQPAVLVGNAILDVNMTDLLKRGRLRLRGVQLDNCTLVFVPNDAGQWQPAGLAPWATWMGKWLDVDLTRPPPAGGAKKDEPVDPAEPPSAKEKAGTEEKMRVAIRQGTISWRLDADQGLAEVAGVSMDITPMKTPQRSLVHYLLSFDHAATANGETIRNLKLEFIDAGDQQLVLVLNADHEKARSK